MPRAVAARVAPIPLLSAAIVNAVLLLLLAVGQSGWAALPPGAEDEIVLIEHLPGRRVHLQDFFWTGVEDAPSWVDPDQTLTLYETRTIHHTATVYIPEEPSRPGGELDGDPSRKPIDCASCIEPTPTLLEDVDQNIGVLVGEDPGPRYWLLTVLKAGENVPPKVELRLARLYKAAFTRQQQRHLGLIGPEIRTRKSYPKRQIIMDNQTTSLPESAADEASLPNETSLSSPSPVVRAPPPISLLRMRAVRIAKSKRTLPILESEEFEELALKPISIEEVTTAAAPRGNDTANKAQLREADIDVGLVQVRMQNMSLIEGGATRLIYTVHLGGKPVPAETAAKDMALLSAQEVALELGAPVIIQSEPLSRKRDAWLLIGAASAGFLLLAIVLLALLVITKRKRAQSAVVAPPGLERRGVLGKDEEYAPTTPGIDNTAYTDETEGRTEATSGHRRTTPGTLSRTPSSQDTIEAADARDVSSENEVMDERRQQARPWDTREYAEIGRKGAPGSRRTQQQGSTAIDRPMSADSVDSALGAGSGTGRVASLESLEKGFGPATAETTGSPHSYLSMPSCKQFPSMRSVEPLSKVLEPVIIKHLDLEPDSPEMKDKTFDYTKNNGNHYFSRAASATKDPGVLGPIVWDLKRKRAVEGNLASPETDVEHGRPPYGPVGRARRRLNELLEDSFSLFGSREPKQQQQPHYQPGPERRIFHPQDSQGGYLQDQFTVLADHRGKSAYASPVTSPGSDGRHRPRTSQPMANEPDPTIPETGTVGPQPRGAWGSRPLSAGPFHRPTLPEVEVARVLADAQLRPEDPAVPLIAAIKKELGKFTYD